MTFEIVIHICINKRYIISYFFIYLTFNFISLILFYNKLFIVKLINIKRLRMM